MYTHPERKPDKGGTILIGRHRPLSRRSWRQFEAWMRQVEYAYSVMGLDVDLIGYDRPGDGSVAVITANGSYECGCNECENGWGCDTYRLAWIMGQAGNVI